MNEKYVKRPHQVKLIFQERERRETHLARLRGPETGARRAQRGSQVSCESPDIVFFLHPAFPLLDPVLSYNYCVASF